MVQSYIKRILNAQVYDVARETPLDAAPLLSVRLGNQAFLKRDEPAHYQHRDFHI